GQGIVAAVGGHRLDIAQPSEAALNGREVGEEAAQPALVDEEHRAALRFFGDDILRLPLGPDKENRPALSGKVADELLGLAKQLHRLAQVDDVDAVPLAEDVLLHLRVPALGLVAEMNAGFEQILHRDRGQHASLTVVSYQSSVFSVLTDN